MTLTATQTDIVNQAIEAEIDVQALLVRARTAAARKLVAYFESEECDESRVPPMIRVAIQLTARAFQPLQAALRRPRSEVTPTPTQTERTRPSASATADESGINAASSPPDPSRASMNRKQRRRDRKLRMQLQQHRQPATMVKSPPTPPGRTATR